MLDGRKRLHGAPCKACNGHALCIDEVFLNEEIQASIGIEDEVRVFVQAVVAMPDPARTETVDRQRDVAPGEKSGSPVFIGQPGIFTAGGQQHDGRKAPAAFGPPEPTAQVERQRAE